MKNIQLKSPLTNLDNYFYSKVTPTKLSNPILISSNQLLAKQLNFSNEDIQSEDFTYMFLLFIRVVIVNDL
jgi:uncharacterized protein YdiU (UPF0061 family)